MNNSNRDKGNIYFSFHGAFKSAFIFTITSPPVSLNCTPSDTEAGSANCTIWCKHVCYTHSTGGGACITDHMMLHTCCVCLAMSIAFHLGNHTVDLPVAVLGGGPGGSVPP